MATNLNAALTAERLHTRAPTRPGRQKKKTNKQSASTFPSRSESMQSLDIAIGRVHPFTMVRCLCTHTTTTSAPTNINKQNKDAFHNSIHFHRARDADLFEHFCRDRLPSDDIYVPAVHQPINPEDEDDVVPDQHAAFGLGQLMGKGPDAGVWKGVGRGGAAGAGAGAGGVVKKTVLPR